MFTGLIQSLGKIASVGQYQFQITYSNKNAHLIKDDLTIGDSIAVDGVCLTVIEILPTGFIADSSQETLNRTTLEVNANLGNYVNLETSLRVGSKLGGHFVTGHVDGIGCLKESIETPTSWEMYFTYSPNLSVQWQDYISRYLISKGSITINGVSLTIADCDRAGNWFKVAVIPHTYKETNLYYLQSGSLVNIETDILGKYVEKLLSYNVNNHIHNDIITPDFLAEHGY